MRLFTIYATAILLGFGLATEQGYAVTSLFGTHRHGAPGAPGTAFYHK